MTNTKKKHPNTIKPLSIVFSKNYPNQARTLPPDYVNDVKYSTGKFTKLHESDWEISGEIREDYFRWVNDFQARHETFGSVCGNFEKTVYFDSMEGYEHFLKHHPYKEWDYGDI
jgi:hypothetical protein